jgi:hypothetical protein
MSRANEAQGIEEPSQPIPQEPRRSITRQKKTAHLTKISDWLKNSISESLDKKYRYRLLEENVDHRDEMIKELQVLVQEAHEDFRQHIRNLLGHSLDPLDPLGQPCITYALDDYPRCWPLKTLKGYFGEIFAGVVAEHLNPFDQDWEIPAFPFRLHMSEFHQLEMWRQTGEEPRTRPGRFGDDLIAFQRNDTGKIIRSLTCEAKCTYRHNKSLIEDAHAKASSKNPVPLDYLKLVEILRDYQEQDSRAHEWIEALRQLQFITKDSLDCERYDLVSYICGLPPALANTETIPQKQPHEMYTGGRWLEAVETRLYDVEGLVEAVYQKEMRFIDESQEPTELENLWQAVLEHVTPRSVKFLATQHCKLLYFDGQRANISVTSLPLFRTVLNKDSQIKAAFTASGLFKPIGKSDKVSIRFITQHPSHSP